MSLHVLIESCKHAGLHAEAEAMLEALSRVLYGPVTREVDDTLAADRALTRCVLAAKKALYGPRDAQSALNRPQDGPRCSHCGLRTPELQEGAALAAAAERMLQQGLLDSRSAVADALLDYRDGRREMRLDAPMKFYCRWHGEAITTAEPYWASAPDGAADRENAMRRRAAETFAEKHWEDAEPGAERRVILGRTMNECNESKFSVTVQVGTQLVFTGRDAE